MSDGMAESVLRLQDEWGRRLLARYPNDLGPAPDFTNDLGARMIWFSEALRELGAQAEAVGEPGKIYMGPSCIEWPDRNDQEATIMLARHAFERAGGLWAVAKLNNDKARAESETAAALQAQVEREIENHRSSMAAETSELLLTESADRLKEGIKEARQAGTDTTAIERKLGHVHARLLELEREGKRRNEMFGWGGIIFGVAGIVLALIAWSFPKLPELVFGTSTAAGC